jgi:hypothetical protein
MSDDNALLIPVYLLESIMHITCIHVICCLLVSAVYFSVMLLLLLYAYFGDEAHLLFVLNLSAADCFQSGFELAGCNPQMQERAVYNSFIYLTWLYNNIVNILQKSILFISSTLQLS